MLLWVLLYVLLSYDEMLEFSLEVKSSGKSTWGFVLSRSCPSKHVVGSKHKAIASCFVYRDTRVLSTELANTHASDIRDATLGLLA